jgi:hypothetical protein
VTEDYARDFSGNWTGDGVISGSGDAEILTLSAVGDEAISETVKVGSGTMLVSVDKYGTGGSGPSVTLYYKTGSTQANCEGDTWHSFVNKFVSSGWVKIRALKEV